MLAGSLLRAVLPWLVGLTQWVRMGVICWALIGITNAQMAFGESRTVLVVGDSISAAYGMNLEQGWVAELDQRLTVAGYDYSIVNASISGDTSGGGLRRLPPLLNRHKPAIVIIELGGNDGLRGYPIAQLRQNLSRMVHMASADGAKVLLLAMEIPPNLGTRYSRLFRESFALVAETGGVQVAPFILDGIATNKRLMQSDGIHPTIEAQPLIVDNIWPYLVPLLES